MPEFCQEHTEPTVHTQNRCTEGKQGHCPIWSSGGGLAEKLFISSPRAYPKLFTLQVGYLPSAIHQSSQLDVFHLTPIHAKSGSAKSHWFL